MQVEHNDSGEIFTTLMGMQIKPCFNYIFEQIDSIERVELICYRHDNLLSLETIRQIFYDIRIEDIETEYIEMLLTFKSGTDFLLEILDKVIERGLVKHLLASPFVDEGNLLIIVDHSNLINEYSEELIAYLAHNLTFTLLTMKNALVANVTICVTLVMILKFV